LVHGAARLNMDWQVQLDLHGMGWHFLVEGGVADE
jgi:hypothetical protein